MGPFSEYIFFVKMLEYLIYKLNKISVKGYFKKLSFTNSWKILHVFFLFN